MICRIFDRIVTLLYGEDRLLKRDYKEQARVAAIRNFNKEPEEEKNARPNESGRGGRSLRGETTSKAAILTRVSPRILTAVITKGTGMPPSALSVRHSLMGRRRDTGLSIVGLKTLIGYLSALKTSLRRTSLVAMTVQTNLWITTILIFRLWQIWLPVKRISWKMWSIGACRPPIPHQFLVASRCARSAQAIYFNNLRS